MSAVSPHILFQHCYGRYAIAAINVFNMEQVLALFSSAQQASSPIIVQITPAARRYAHPTILQKMVEAASEIFPDVVYALHLDHGVEEHVFDAIENNYNSVMIDASHDDYNTNIRRTRAVVDIANLRNVFVEAELGVLSGVEDDLTVDSEKSFYTDPEQASHFVMATGCNSLAIAVGTSHGAYKFSGSRGIQFQILSAIQKRLPGFPLVLHGSSNVNKQDIAEINRYGGRLSESASGVTDEDVQRAISFGICKVNLATDLRLLWTKVHRKFFIERPDQFDPVVPGKEYMEVYKEYMLNRFGVLGSAGQSSAFNLLHHEVKQ